MTNRPASRQTLADLQRALLDGQFNRVMALIYQAIGRDFARTGLLGKRLADIEARAKELDADGKPMTLETPEVSAFLADYERSLRRYAALLDSVAESIQVTGVTAGLAIAERTTLAGLEATQFARRWQRPAQGVLTELVKYVSKPEFKQRVDDYPSAVIKIISGVVRGKNPIATARALRTVSPSLTSYGANSLMRTLQMTAYRDATAASYVANADILEPVCIRIAALQVGRTCLACIALHGTEIPLGSRVDDHDNGRCTSIAIIRGRPRNIQTGIDWFGGLTTDQKRTIAGQSAYEAISRGDVTLPEFVGRRTDPIFGPQIEALSLKKLFGPAAQDYYKAGREARRQ